MKADGGDFVTGGHLGYMNFPTVEGGKGDPSNTVGNPGQYLSISSKATDAQKETAKKFFATAVLDDAEVGGVGRDRQRPDRQGRGRQVRRGSDAEFLKFVYDTASNAKIFAQSWDQALSPTAAETLLDNIAKLFQLSITPEQWVENMNKVIGQVTRVPVGGQVTALAAPAAVQAAPARPAGGSGGIAGANAHLDGAAGVRVLPALRHRAAAGGAGAVLHHLGRHRPDHLQRADELAGRAERPGAAALAVGHLPGDGAELAGPDAR